jgi:hypothetical protein
LELEGKLDDALGAKTSLEAELQSLREKLDREVGSLREQLDAEKLKAPTSASGTGGQRAGASMLSEQFRATMKEERKKFQDELRVSMVSIFCHYHSVLSPSLFLFESDYSGTNIGRRTSN